MKKLDFNSKEKIYFVADCFEQTIKSYTFQKFYYDVVFDFIDRNFDPFEIAANRFLEKYPQSKLAKNLVEVLSGDAEPKNLAKMIFILFAIHLNRKQKDEILFSVNLDECQKWNKNIKLKLYYCD